MARLSKFQREQMVNSIKAIDHRLTTGFVPTTLYVTNPSDEQEVALRVECWRRDQSNQRRAIVNALIDNGYASDGSKLKVHS